MLRDYRWNVVRPVLAEYDRSAFFKVASVDLPGLVMPFTMFHPEPSRIPVDLVSVAQDKQAWRKYRAWAVARCSGRWPLTVLGGTEVPTKLPICGLCAAPEVTILHSLCHCPGTARLWSVLAAAISVPPRDEVNVVVQLLFDYERVVESRSLCVDFVGSSLLACVVTQVPHPAVMGDDEMDSEGDGGEDRLLAMLQLDILEAAEAGTSRGHDVETTSEDDFVGEASEE